MILIMAPQRLFSSDWKPKNLNCWIESDICRQQSSKSSAFFNDFDLSLLLPGLLLFGLTQFGSFRFLVASIEKQMGNT